MADFRPELAHGVSAGVGAQSDAARGHSAGDGTKPGRLPQAGYKSTSYRAGDAPGGHGRPSVGRFSRNDRAKQGMPHPRTETLLPGWVIFQVLMPHSRHSELDGTPPHVRTHRASEPLGATRGAGPPFVRPTGNLAHSAADARPDDRRLPRPLRCKRGLVALPR